jgi:2',3'-cyclic-nucleotide 2'-phosphodiesterase/3'-nucleotidase
MVVAACRRGRDRRRRRPRRRVLRGARDHAAVRRQPHVPSHRAGHDRPARSRGELGLLQERPVQRNAVGLAKVSTVVNDIRAQKGRDHTLLIDAGDTIQGTPLSTYYAKVDPITDGHVMHPMALAMNAIGYDAAAIGNHEFNYGPDLPTENASALLAQKVPGIDAILVGHSHRDIPELFVTNEQTGKRVLLSEPALWGERVTDMELTLTKSRGQWSVGDESATNINTNAYPEDPSILALLKPQHDTVVQWVNTPIGNSVQAMDSSASRYSDTPIIDLINQVQTDAVRTALAGTADASLPVVSIAAPFSRTASFPAGPVSIRDVAGLYIYDNTLLAVRMTGAEIKDYLEYSARYFNHRAPGDPVDIDTLTNAVTPDATTGIPDYNDDELSGVSYDIDIAQPAGSRIENLRLPDGTPVQPDQEFVVAVNNYRESGGGGFPHIASAPVLMDQQQDIRQLIIDWVTAKGVVDPADFFTPSWQLTRDGVPLF